MRYALLFFCFFITTASWADDPFTWTQGLGNGWVIKKNVVSAGNGLAILAVAVPPGQMKLPPGVDQAEPFEFVGGVVKDFNRNGVADSDERFSFRVRGTVFVFLPPTQNPNPHILAQPSQSSVQHRIILEFMDDAGCSYGRPEDMRRDPDGKLIIDFLAGPCRADR